MRRACVAQNTPLMAEKRAKEKDDMEVDGKETAGENKKKKNAKRFLDTEAESAKKNEEEEEDEEEDGDYEDGDEDEEEEDEEDTDGVIDSLSEEYEKLGDADVKNMSNDEKAERFVKLAERHQMLKEKKEMKRKRENDKIMEEWEKKQREEIDNADEEREQLLDAKRLRKEKERCSRCWRDVRRASGGMRFTLCNLHYQESEKVRLEKETETINKILTKCQQKSQKSYAEVAKEVEEKHGDEVAEETLKIQQKSKRGTPLPIHAREAIKIVAKRYGLWLWGD